MFSPGEARMWVFQLPGKCYPQMAAISIVLGFI